MTYLKKKNELFNTEPVNGFRSNLTEIFIKLAWIHVYHWDIPSSLLGFGDRGLAFKIGI